MLLMFLGVLLMKVFICDLLKISMYILRGGKTMNKKIVSIIVCIALIAAILAGCAGKGTTNSSSGESKKKVESTEEKKEDKKEASNEKEAPKEAIVLKFGHVNSEQTSYHKGIVKFKEEVEKNSNGAIKVEVFPNSQLGNERDLIEGMQLGTIDCAFVATAPLASFVPEFAILDAPFLYRDSEHAFKVADGEIGQSLSKKLQEKQGISVMGFMDVGFRNIFSNKPVKTIEDLKGLKIRTMENKLHIESFRKLGALPTPMAYGEVFTALQQKTIDAAENAIQNVLNQKFYEVTKNVTKTGHFYCMTVICISDKSLNKIPNEMRPVIMEAAKVACKYQRELAAQDNQAAEDELKKLGVQFYEIDRNVLAEMVSSVYQDAQFKDVLNSEMIEKVKNTK